MHSDGEVCEWRRAPVIGPQEERAPNRDPTGLTKPTTSHNQTNISNNNHLGQSLERAASLRKTFDHPFPTLFFHRLAGGAWSFVS